MSTLDWALAVAPITLVLVLMVGRRWGADRAGIVGWLAAVLVAALRFGAGWSVLAAALGKSALLAAYVLYIIWMALLFYHVVDEAGAITAIERGLSNLTTDRGLQALLLSWAFGAFLQGVSGFGVPTAIVAPLLVGAGFVPAVAVVIASLGHAWAVTFGSLAAAFLALIAATGRTGVELAPASALLSGLACLGCGVAVCWAAGGWRMAARKAGYVAALGLVMRGVQFGLAAIGLFTLAAVGAGLAGLAALAGIVRWEMRHRLAATSAESMSPGGMSLAWPLFPYALLVVIVSLAQLAHPITVLLDVVTIRINFPATQTALGYETPTEAGRTISVFGHAGALLAYTAVLSFVAFRRRGYLPVGAAWRVVRKTVSGALSASIGIMAMVAMAVTMDHAGMTRLLAEELATAAGAAFPLISPFIGALGAFMTGSNTNSNVIFGALQDRAARLLSLNPAIILAAQTAGGAIGGAFAPAKIIIGCSTVGLAGREGEALKKTMAYGVTILIGVGLVAWALAGR